MKIKVLAIAPYPGLKELLEAEAHEDARLELEVHVADLQNALPIVQASRSRSYDVILSRGGTSSLIRKHVSTPVVDVPVSGYDILRVLTLVRGANSKVAIIGFPNICRGVAEVSGLLDFDISSYPIQSAGEVEEALRQAFGDGVQLVLGDVVTVQAAEAMGYNGILITSGRESVLEALAEVRRMYSVVNRAQANERLYSQLLERHHAGVLAVDGKGTILYANKAAALLLGYDPGVIRGMNLRGIDPLWARYIGEPVPGVEGTAAGPSRRFQRRGLNIEVAPADPVNAMDCRYFVYMVPLGESATNPAFAGYEVTERIATFAQIIGGSGEIRGAVSRARALSRSDRPVWIEGEAGTGKGLFVQAIHSASRSGAEGLFMLPCGSLSGGELESLLFGSESYAGLLHTEAAGTVGLMQIEQTGSPLQLRLAEYLQGKGGVRLVGTSLQPVKSLLKKGEIEPELARAFQDSILHLPPLRERLEDIEDIARVVIAAHNSRYGKQIAGIRPDVVEEELQQILWPGNVRQLKMVLEHMLAASKGPYVGAAEAKEGWRKVRETLRMEAESQTVQLNLSGTWDEIERRILLEVLREEEMNQSKAAKRLGINRSTLWRKLKEVLQNKT